MESKISRDPNDYPDLTFDAALDSKVATLKRLPGTTVAPRIKWGEQYNALPIEERCKRAERVADAMNHAADVAQKQWFEMLETLAHKEKQIEQAQPQVESMREVLHHQLTRGNDEKAELERDIIALRKENRELHKQIKQLEAASS